MGSPPASADMRRVEASRRGCERCWCGYAAAIEEGDLGTCKSVDSQLIVWDPPGWTFLALPFLLFGHFL